MKNGKSVTAIVVATFGLIATEAEVHPALADGRRSCPEFKADSTDPLDRSRPLVHQFNLVRAVAIKLSARGYSGKSDGTYTNELSSLVRLIQKESGLSQTGDLDCETVKRILGVDLRERRQ